MNVTQIYEQKKEDKKRMQGHIDLEKLNAETENDHARKKKTDAHNKVKNFKAAGFEDINAELLKYVVVETYYSKNYFTFITQLCLGSIAEYQENANNTCCMCSVKCSK